MIVSLVMTLALQSSVPVHIDSGSQYVASSISAVSSDEISAVLDRMHDAAARADGDSYFALYAPNARFIGTDAGEHWSLDQFRAYSDPVFARGQGWTYVPSDRTVTVSGDVAWFDEKLSHASYGALRGSGVLRRQDAGSPWLIEQYVLSFTVPNDTARSVVDVIASGSAE